jgi:hypothetical protein
LLRPALRRIAKVSVDTAIPAEWKVFIRDEWNLQHGTPIGKKGFH